MKRSRTCLMQHLLLSMPSAKRWSGPGGCGAQVCLLSGGGAGLTDQQMEGQLHRWGTHLPHSQLHLMLETATLTLISPTPIPPAVPSALNCSLAPTRLCPGTPCGICPLKTRVVPPPNLALMNRLYSPGNDAAFRCPTTPRQNAKTRQIHRTGHHDARGARLAASPLAKQMEPPLLPPLLASRAGIQGQWPQCSGRPTDKRWTERREQKAIHQTNSWH